MNNANEKALSVIELEVKKKRTGFNLNQADKWC